MNNPIYVQVPGVQNKKYDSRSNGLGLLNMLRQVKRTKHTPKNTSTSQKVSSITTFHHLQNTCGTVKNKMVLGKGK